MKFWFFFSTLIWGHSQTTWTAIVGGWVRKGIHSVHLYYGKCPPKVGVWVKKCQKCVHVVCERPHFENVGIFRSMKKFWSGKADNILIMEK